MWKKKTAKRTASIVLLALALVATSLGAWASPLAQAPDEAPSAIGCGDFASCAMGGPAVQVYNSGTGAAIYGQNTSGVSGAGVYGRSTQGAGVRAQSNSGNGVFASSYNTAGVRGRSTWGMGVKGESVNNMGVHGTGSTGVYGESSAYSGEGVHGHGTNFLTEGVLGTSDQNVGVYGISGGTQGNNIGVWGETAGTWGFYSNQNILVNGCTGCTLSFVGRNANGSALQVGDLVSASGVEPPFEGQKTPILKVRRATTGSAVLGIVLARAEVSTAQARVPGADSNARKAVEIAGMAEGSVAPGDYLFIVVQGLVQVRADAVAGIQAGDRLMVGSGGLADLGAPGAQTIGQAVDAVDPATGLVWVLVDLQ